MIRSVVEGYQSRFEKAQKLFTRSAKAHTEWVRDMVSRLWESYNEKNAPNIFYDVVNLDSDGEWICEVELLATRMGDSYHYFYEGDSYDTKYNGIALIRIFHFMEFVANKLNVPVKIVFLADKRNNYRHKKK